MRMVALESEAIFDRVKLTSLPSVMKQFDLYLAVHFVVLAIGNSGRYCSILRPLLFHLVTIYYRSS